MNGTGTATRPSRCRAGLPETEDRQKDMFARLSEWKRRFYGGPRDLGVEPYRNRGYQSPTLTLLLWGYAAVVRHLTLSGRILVLCSGVLFPYAMVSTRMPIHLLAFAVLSLLALDAAAGLFFRPRVEARRSMPPRIAAGADIRVDYRVASETSRPLLDLSLDVLPYPNTIRMPGGHAYIRTLRPGETVRCSTYIRARRRGKYVLPALRVASGFPFHLWRWGASGQGIQRLLVYPRFTPLHQLTLPIGLRYQPGGIALSSRVGGSMEFLGCREFRDGDDPRRLHWRSWARTGFPVVKEFREEYLCRAALIVDTHRPPPKIPWLTGSTGDQPFEAALSLAAAVTDFLARQDYIVDLFAAGPEIYRFQGGRSLAYLDNVLDILACLESHPKEPFEDLAPCLVEEVSRISSALVILLCWNDVRRKLIEEMKTAGVSVYPILVTGTPEKYTDLPGAVTLLSAQDVVQGRCTEL